MKVPIWWNQNGAIPMKRAWTLELLDAARRELDRKVRGRLAFAVANPSLRRAFVQELAEFVALMRENGHAGTTRTPYSSMDSFFSCFCVETGIDYEVTLLCPYKQ